jgi:protein pelota
MFLYTRKVQTESATGSTSSNKVRTMLTVKVEHIDFDTQACVLRVKGRNIQENQYVKVKYSLNDIQLLGFQFSVELWK